MATISFFGPTTSGRAIHVHQPVAPADEPLVIGCDLENLDDFTLSLLANDEVIDVNQDALCGQTISVAEKGDQRVYAKSMEDGTWTVGFFNLGRAPVTVGVAWTALGVQGQQRVRDLWLQKDLGEFADGFSEEIEPHGIVLLRVAAVK